MSNPILGQHERAFETLQSLQALVDRQVRSEEGCGETVKGYSSEWDELVGRLPAVLGVMLQPASSAVRHGDKQVRLAMLKQQDDEVAAYRRALQRSRRNVIAGRLRQLIQQVDDALAELSARIPPGDDHNWQVQVGPHQSRWTSKPRPETAELWVAMDSAISELFGLIKNDLTTPGMWGDMFRHLNFAQVVDLEDLVNTDWPAARAFVTTLLPPDDIGVARERDAPPPPPPIAGKLAWGRLTAGQFEELIRDILLAEPDYENITYNVPVNIPDYGRDIECATRLADAARTAWRTERTIVQCKHWQKRNMSERDLNDLVTRLGLLDGAPVVHVIVALSGGITNDAQAWINKREAAHALPRVQIWGDTTLSQLLDRHRELVEKYELRP